MHSAVSFVGLDCARAKENVIIFYQTQFFPKSYANKKAPLENSGAFEELIYSSLTLGIKCQT